MRTCRIAGTEGAELRFRPSRGTPPLLIVSDFHDWHRYFTHCVTVTGGGKLSRLIRRIIAANKNRGTATFRDNHLTPTRPAWTIQPAGKDNIETHYWAMQDANFNVMGSP